MSKEYPVTEFENKAEFNDWLNAFNSQAMQPNVKLESINSCHQLTCQESKRNCANVMFFAAGRVEVRFW
jgi:hypothetical protein